MAVVTVPKGSLIIPMDTTYQNMGMWTAYGLVYRLLQNGIPVEWAIQSGKPWMGTDFTATATDFQTGTLVAAHTYKGGPFIIDVADAAAATPIITAWQSAYPNTKVHVATNSFSADIGTTLLSPPRIAVEASNSGIITTYLKAAGIPDSTGKAWPSNSPDILNETEIGAEALFNYSSALCRRRAYDIFLSPHTGSGTWDLPALQTSLNAFLRLGGHLHATCYSITAIENQLFFLTTSGITKTNGGLAGTFTVDYPDHPLDQAVATTPAQGMPGGSEQTWLRAPLTYYPTTRTMAHFLNKKGGQEDFMIAGPYKGGTGAGYISYEGGHSYAVTLPYLNNFEGPYLRFLYNAIFLAKGLPEIDVQVSPTKAPVGAITPITVAVNNVGGEDGNVTNLTITLDASVNPASVVWTVAPDVGSAFPTYTWTGFTAPANSTVITGTMTAQPLSAGTLQLANFTATYTDPQLNPYTMSQCTTLQAEAGPIPVVRKTPDPENTTPNQNVTWTIDTGNTAAVSTPDTTTLSNVVLTDVVPAGLTFVSASPAPTTNTLNPDGTRTLTWDLLDIPPATPLGSGPVVTVTVLTPPHTTAVYTNTVTLAGTDPAGNPGFEATDTALLNEVNQAPTVTKYQPVPPGPLSGTVQVCFNGSDPDGDPIFYDAYYSPDGGTNWVQFATSVSGPNPVCVPFNTVGLNGDNFRIRVVVTDTELTGEDEEGPFVVDNTPPQVALIAPPDGSTVCGQVTLEADATDTGTGVKTVTFEYSLDGGTTWTGIGTVFSGPPWTLDWETSLQPDGPIQVRAVATDNVGNTATSNVFSYTIDNTPPTVAIVAPPDGTTVTGTVTVVGTASDNIALNRVEWRIDGVLQAVQTVPPFDFVWDSTQFMDGPHTFTLTAYDNCPNSAVATITLIADNVPDHATEVGVDDEIIIPPQKPPAEQLLPAIVQVEVTKTQVIHTPIGGKVIVTGIVHVLVPYVADEPQQGMHAVEIDIPWQTFILWPELPADAAVKVTILMESADFKLLDPRTISKFIVFLVGVEEA